MYYKQFLNIFKHKYASIICACGNEKHPNSSLVYYLSKYGNVYSTHKTPRLFYTSDKVIKPATPLKKKIQ